MRNRSHQIAGKSDSLFTTHASSARKDWRKAKFRGSLGSVECPTAGNTWKDRPTPGCKRHICTYLYHRLLAEGTLSYACKVSRRWTITWSASQPATGLIGWLLGIYVLMSTQADRGDHPSECNLPSLNFFMWALF